MKKALGLSLLSTVALLSLPARADAQVLCALGSTTSFESMADMPAGAEAQADVKRLKSLLCPKGCGKLFLFANPTSPNSVTATDGHGASKIVYSPAFFAAIRKDYGPLGTVGMFAHELGHHLDAIGNRPAWIKAAWDSELRADAWAGCAMAKAELKPSALQASLLVLSEFPSARHPAWADRRAVITEGYKQCGGRVLPALAKEAPEPAGGVLASTNAGDGAATTASPAGCASDRDCRNGRACVNSRCSTPPERRRCGKDTDCPDPLECDANGLCTTPTGQASGQQAPAKPAAPLLTAALQGPAQGQRTVAPIGAAAEAPSSCLKTCDEVRNMCVEAATSESNRCLATIQSEPGYRGCTCPSYPAGNAECYAYCTGAYERSKGCSAATVVRDCRGDGERCRARCQ